VDPFSIAAIVATLAGAGIQAYSQNRALKKQESLAREAQQRQLNAQNQATQLAAKRAGEFDPSARKESQDAIAQEMTGEMDRQVAQPQITAQGVQVGATLPEGAGTTDYLAAKAREQAKTTASLRGLAALMGRIGSASELRRKEAVGFGDTAGAIGRIQTGAGNEFGIDQVGINSVRPNVGAMLAGQALSAYGSAGAPGMGGKAKYPEYGMASGPTGAWL
jgi:hypothetical protein